MSFTLDSAYLLAPKINSTYSTLTVSNGSFTDLNTKLTAAKFRFSALSTHDGLTFAASYDGTHFTETNEGYIQFAIKANFAQMQKFRTNVEVEMGNISINDVAKPRWLRMHVLQRKTIDLNTNPITLGAIFSTTTNTSGAYDGAIFANQFPNTPKGYDSAMPGTKLSTLGNAYVCGTDTATMTTGNSYLSDSGSTWYIFTLYLEGTVGDDMQSIPAQNITFDISLTAEKIS